VHPQYKALWEKYLEQHGYHGDMTPAAIWGAYQHMLTWREGLSAEELVVVRHRMAPYMISHKTVEIGGVTFWDSHVKEHRSWFLFPQNDDDAGVIYFGRIDQVFSHIGPGGAQSSVLLKVQYFRAKQRRNQAYEPYDYMMCAPVVSKVAVPMAYGSVWPASDIVPVAITVMPHPTVKDQLVMLHRDVFFAMAGGHPGPDVYRMLL
jgi:hypothetical protein